MDGKISGVRYGVVVSVNDDAGADRIAVRLIPEDNNKVRDELIEARAFPLMPKAIFIKPKVGEGVFVILATLNDGNSQRYYIGPVVSQVHRMLYEPAREGGDSYQNGAKKDFDVSPYLHKDAKGLFPGSEDIAIMGRKDTEIILKDDDIRIRAGVRLTGDNYQIVYNRKNPAYIKLAYHENALDGDNHSTATIVADKINLLSNKSTEEPTGINLTDTESLISDSDLNEVINEAYRLPYGEKLVKLLKTMIKVFNEHTHDYIALPPNSFYIAEMNSAAKEPLDEERLLSDGIRIN